MSRHHGIVNELQVVATTGFIILRRLFTLHLLGAIVVNHRLVKLVCLAIFGEHPRLDDKLTTAYRLVISVCKIQMLFPIRDFSAASRRIQIVRRRIGIEKPRTRRERVVRRLFLKLHAQHKDFESVRRLHERCKREDP